MASCEIVWVRCNEPAGPLLRLVNRTGQRLSIVDKCEAHTSASAMRVRNSPSLAITGCSYLPGTITKRSPTPNQVQNVGEEGFGYLSWIVERWETLPPCAFLLHGGWKRRARLWGMVQPHDPTRLTVTVP